MGLSVLWSVKFTVKGLQPLVAVAEKLATGAPPVVFVEKAGDVPYSELELLQLVMAYTLR